ncbi:MAG: VWA domain-containing protein [Myxococcales bacterium]|nr:VWA domain-containing protein [Myxococcales bacterium]
MPAWLAVACGDARTDAAIDDDDSAGENGDAGETGSASLSASDGNGSASDGAETGAASSAGGDEGGDPPPDDTGVEDTGDDTTTTGEPACDDQEPVSLFLSPDDSNSMSSPVQARDAVLGGWSSITAAPIRPWEFLNYYTFAYPPAPAGQVIVTPTLARDPDDPTGEYLLQIGVSSEAMGEDRPPINLALVLDTSGSMEGTSMDMLKESCRVIARSLQAGDTISMVTWNTENLVILEGRTVEGPDDAELLAAIEALSASGGTDLYSGLTAGYALANEVYDTDRINRIVLISDGGANVGVTEVELIAEQANISGADGIYLVGVGVGEAGVYNDTLMDEVTDAGKGASVFISTAAEAQKVFGERFTSTFSVAVRDVQVQLELPPGFEIVKFSGEEYSTDPAEVEPQHLAPDDAMVFHQRISTCAPELVLDDTPITVTARFEDPLSGEAREVAVEASFAELLAAEPALLRKGAAVFGYAEALKAWKSATDDETRAAIIADALAEIARAAELLPADPDLQEIRTVLEAM